MSETTKRSKLDVAKEVVRNTYDAHKEALTMKNAGRLLGKGAFKVVKPFVSLYDGVKDGFKSGQ